MKKIKALILKPVVMIRPAMPAIGMTPAMPIGPATPAKAVTPVRAAKATKPVKTMKPVKAKPEPGVDALDKPHRVPGKPNHYIYK